MLVWRHAFAHPVAALAAANVRCLLLRGDVLGAVKLSSRHEIPRIQARVLQAQGDNEGALALLTAYRQEVEGKNWQDERLKTMALQAVVLQGLGQKEQAARVIGGALALAYPGGLKRVFIDEGLPMAQLLCRTLPQNVAPEYVRALLQAFPDSEASQASGKPKRDAEFDWIEPLSAREIEVLQLVAPGTNESRSGRPALSVAQHGEGAQSQHF